MKSNILSIVALVATFILYILHFTNDSSSNVELDKPVMEAKIDSLKNQSTLVKDSLSLDSLETASFSRVGVLDVFDVIEGCPVLAKTFKKNQAELKSLQQRQYNIEKNLYDYQEAKQKELTEKQSKGTLLPSVLEYEQKVLYQKSIEAEQAIKSLQPLFIKLQERETKNGAERNKIIKKAIDIVNNQLKLDYILVNNGTMNNVIPLSDTNNITNVIISTINNKL
ncbi:MAG: hypothetical protein CMP61_06935 [Flavobacteriales bacterium]|nr:hypothetical protein [Flavobacteriales bacterium]|tara:strand:+ start:4056 stop:4727 length:672 start_codon:yes stop_codon:yes gene_type:complete